jgi:RNA polymerase sigma-70 factor, ECF subfamily
MARSGEAMTVSEEPLSASDEQDVLYKEAAANYGSALGRLARAYESDSDKRSDLLQEIHVELWRSFATFDGRCSMRTWLYRVAHNVASSHVQRAIKRRPMDLVSLDVLEATPSEIDTEASLDRRLKAARLLELVQRLAPLERQVILLYLEGLDAASIAEVTGLSSGNIATKIHRIKTILAHQFGDRGVS